AVVAALVADGSLPKDLAVRHAGCDQAGGAVGFAQGVEVFSCHHDAGESTAEARLLPGERRTILGPLFQETGVWREAVALRAAELAPVGNGGRAFHLLRLRGDEGRRADERHQKRDESEFHCVHDPVLQNASTNAVIISSYLAFKS